MKRIGRFYWLQGVFSSEIERAMALDYARRYRWLLTRRAQRGVVALNVAVWLLAMYGATDGPVSLGIEDSPFSWWSVLTVPAYLVLRSSIRLVADAPDELLDERFIAARDRAHLVAYRWLGLLILLGLGFVIGVLDGADGAVPGGDAMWFSLMLAGFIVASLPSMVLAWGGMLADRD